MGPGGMGEQAALFPQIMSIIEDEYQKAEKDKPTNKPEPDKGNTRISLFDKSANPMEGKSGLAATVRTPDAG